jgi:hypothetical protein
MGRKTRVSEQDSFINEVSEEVRKDRLYKLMKRYGWIAILLVVLVVGGASVFEWQKAKARAEAEATGDALLTALQEETPEARNEALGNLTPSDTAGNRALVGLLQAAASAEAEDPETARSTLNGIANDTDTPDVYRDLARLKAAILPGGDPEDRIAQLEPIMVPGNPFRLLAIEQRALAELEMGDSAAALQTFQDILADADVTEGLRRRAQQLIVALGGTLDES